MQSLPILYEDNHLLVVNKPAGIATMGSESGATVHSLAADYLKRTYQKPGNVYVGIVSRLDAMTSGVLVLTRTSKAAARLSAQFARTGDSAPAKVYLAAVEGDVAVEAGTEVATWSDSVRKDDAARRMRVVAKEAAGSKLASLQFLAVRRQSDQTVVAVRLMTGRKHQIRLQFAHRKHPVLGDRKYGARSSFPQGIALHSWRLRIEHPTRREPMWFEVDPPRAWKSLAGGAPNLRKLRTDVATALDLREG